MPGISTIAIELVAYGGDQGGAVMTRDINSRWRSLAKAASWRLIAVTITTSITWGLTGDTAFAATIGALDAFVKFGSYYLHERVWDQIDFGRAQQSCVPFCFPERSEKNDVADVCSRGCA